MVKFLALVGVFSSFFLYGEEARVGFIPPSGWKIANVEELPKCIQVMVVGKGAKGFPPSMNLSSEVFPGTLREYLKVIQALNSSHGNEWKDLGTIRTEAGDASLSQSIQKTQWGEVQMMHAILTKEGSVYILTASALKDEFPNHYKQFFDSLRSLHWNSFAVNSPEVYK